MRRRLPALLFPFVAACGEAPPLPPDASPPSETLAFGDGYDAPLASGRVLAVDDLWVAEHDEGFDLGGSCSGCPQNRLWPVARDLGNGLRHMMFIGPNFVLLEIAGLDPALPTDEVTVKLYFGPDGDMPEFPANNFGEYFDADVGCCRFFAAPESLVAESEDAQPVIRMRALREGRRVRSAAPVRARFLMRGLNLYAPLAYYEDEKEADLPRCQVVWSLEIARAQIDLTLSADLGRVEDGVFGGAITLRSLALGPELVAPYYDRVGPADVDLDGDGEEAFELDAEGQLIGCVDGDGAAIPPRVPGDSASCALQPELADGISAAFRFTTVQATLLGVRQPEDL